MSIFHIGLYFKLVIVQINASHYTHIEIIILCHWMAKQFAPVD